MHNRTPEILVVDRYAASVRTVDRLRHLPVRVLCVSDFDLALSVLAKRQIKLVAVELMLEDSPTYGDALSVIQTIRRKYPKVPVVLHTSAYQGVSVERDEITMTADVTAVCLKDARGPEDDLPTCVANLLQPETKYRTTNVHGEGLERDRNASPRNQATANTESVTSKQTFAGSR